MTYFFEKLQFPYPVSYSQIETYKNCPKRYYYKYIHKPKLPDRTSLRALLGNGMHTALERFYKLRKEDKTPDLPFLIDNFSDGFWSAITRAGDTLQVEGDRDAQMCDLFDVGKKLLDKFHREYYAGIAHRWEVIEAEMKFERQLPPELQKQYPGIGATTFIGYVDLVERDRITKEYRVVDHKTSYEFKDEKMEFNIQHTLYSFFVNLILGIRATSVAYQVFTTNKRALNLYWINGTRGDAHWTTMLQDLNMTFPAMKLGYPVRIEGEHCRFCLVKDWCHKFQPVPGGVV